MAVKMFFCFAHKDEPLLNKLKSHLRPLLREGLIDIWYDRDITAGTEWEQEIKKHLDTAEIILLLISSDFMDSDYCYSIEMNRGLERHNRGEARVIPIILRHTYWQGKPLGDLQALPTNAKPITSWHNRDEAYLDVVIGLLQVIRKLLLPNEAEIQIHASTFDKVRQEAANILKQLQSTPVEALGNRYKLGIPIGRGGMATVYRGRDMREQNEVAIKVLHQVYTTDSLFMQRFQREAKVMSGLQHPNIVRVFSYGQSGNDYFIVMELIEGTDLRRYLRSRQGPLDFERSIIIAHDVALGLGAAHRRTILHRDVKPQNVLVGRDGSIKLTDFGIANIYKDIKAESLTTSSMSYNSVQYFAPEQTVENILSPAADVYARGIIMYEMLTGQTPFQGDSAVSIAMKHVKDSPIPPSQYIPSIPKALEEIVLRCLEKVPELRFRDGSQLARALELLGEEDFQT